MKLFRIFLWIIIGVSLGNCTGNKKRYLYEEGMVWNTLYHITYESDVDLADSIFHCFNTIDNSLSPFNAESTVSRVNKNITDTVDSNFITVYNESLRINTASEGAFDPTLGPVIKAWGFGQGHTISSDTSRVDSLMSFVGISKTELSDNRLIKSDPRTEFNFSALAKGYGVDRIAEMFLANGVENFLIEIGGEIRTSGHNSKGNKWSIGIDRPDQESTAGETVITIYVNDASVATSGNYRNYHTSANNQTFGHTISPITGKPVATEVISATVITDQCITADAIATACMVMGKDKSITLCSQMKVGVILIFNDFSIYTNDIFKQYL